jgi:hypothetical protein
LDQITPKLEQVAHMPTEKLPLHEWLIVCLLVTAMLSLALMTLWHNSNHLPPTHAPHILQEIRVSIQGAVKNPGTYTFKKGATWGDILALAAPLLEADLRKIKMERKLKHEQTIQVRFKSMLTIYVEGAVVEPGAIEVPEGTQLKDLFQYTQFLPHANLELLEKKRRLKDGETIYVQNKKPTSSKKSKF